MPVGAELPEADVCHTYPGDDELPTQVLHLGLHLAADVELVAVERDALQVGQQVLLARRVRALREHRAHQSCRTTAGAADRQTD